ncbi:MAG: patatin-like phospholipase family protein [Candidatus Izemoplasmatales bacterium]|nr:patatin-like phospholipase family protein [Candidatus Izemoplasmatales bacterium]
MRKIGLCLAGGGARGAYQIGACKALEDLGILSNVYAFSGTSIGSVNACLISTMKPDEVGKIWFSISPDLLKKTENIFKTIIKERMEFKESGFFEIGELEKMLISHLDVDKLRKQKVFVTLSEGGAAFEGIFGLIKASYQHYIKKDSKVVYSPINKIKDEKMVYKQILASCSIPLIFAPTELGDHQYYDGGVYDNVPIKPLVDAGCDTVIVIHLHKIHFVDRNRFPNIKILEIETKEHLGGILNFDPEKSKKIFDFGYQDTIKFFDNHFF